MFYFYEAEVFGLPFLRFSLIIDARFIGFCFGALVVFFFIFGVFGVRWLRKTAGNSFHVWWCVANRAKVRRGGASLNQISYRLSFSFTLLITFWLRRIKWLCLFLQQQPFSISKPSSHVWTKTILDSLAIRKMDLSSCATSRVFLRAKSQKML